MPFMYFMSPLLIMSISTFTSSHFKPLMYLTSLMMKSSSQVRMLISSFVSWPFPNVLFRSSIISSKVAAYPDKILLVAAVHVYYPGQWKETFIRVEHWIKSNTVLFLILSHTLDFRYSFSFHFLSGSHSIVSPPELFILFCPYHPSSLV